MNSSQESCRELFNCSCEALDEMTSLAVKYGAYGSRLTGAGWGGCTVSLVSADKIEDFIYSLKKGYYQKLLPNVALDDPILNQYIFASKPGPGCGIFDNSNF
jgi:galactokinase